MIKYFTILILFLFCSSCLGVQSVCDAIYRNASFSSGTKKFLCGDGIKSSFGAKHYKYRCKTTNDCCEEGKNCEEDLKKEESKK